MKKKYIINIVVFIIAVISVSILYKNNRENVKNNAVIVPNQYTSSDINKEENNKSTSVLTNEETKELNSIADEEREKLKYDEAINIEFKGNKVVITGTKPLSEIDEVNGYYPDINIPLQLDDYTFESVMIYDDISSIWAISNEKILVQEELGRVYKRELSNETIKSIELKYAKNNGIVDLILYKDIEVVDKDAFERDYNIKLMIDGDTKYFVLKDKESDEPKGVYFETQIDNNDVGIKVTISNKELQRNISAQDMLDTIKLQDINKYIRELSIFKNTTE